MKVLIVVFSPSGNTYKVANILSDMLADKGEQVQLINLTRNKEYFYNKKEYLKEKINEHDVICIGGPVYAHFFPTPLIDFIKNLPKPNKKWGRLAVPFLTYGKITSGIALLDAAELLNRSGRVNVLGLKINSFHSYSRKFKNKINEGMPGKESIPYIEELVDKIINLEISSQQKDVINEFNYKSEEEKENSRKRRESVVFPKIEFNYNNCNKCGACEKVCPVLNIEIEANGPKIINFNKCISCSECFHVCSKGGIVYDVLKFENKLTAISQGKDPYIKPELPDSKVFY